jgi:hypothetical protein
MHVVFKLHVHVLCSLNILFTTESQSTTTVDNALLYPDLGFAITQSILIAISIRGSSFEVISASCFAGSGMVKPHIVQRGKQVLLVIYNVVHLLEHDFHSSTLILPKII